MRYVLRNMMLVAMALFVVSCSNDDNVWRDDSDFLYLKNKEAVMPVCVAGDVASGVFIVVNHGGPGTVSGLRFRRSKHFFQRLESKYAVVYWDQRMSGASKGDASLDDMSIDLHIEDLEKLMTLLRSRYQMNSTFVYGHSWGGGLSIGYLGKGDNQVGINGWIDEDGALQDRYEMDLKREWILPRAEQKLADTGDGYWQEALDWWEANPNPDESSWEPYQHVQALGGYVYDVEVWKKYNRKEDFPEILSSSVPFMWKWNQYVDCEWVAGYDFMPSAKEIKIPSLLLWGKEDGSVPVPLSDSLYKLLKTPVADKYLYQYDKCGHTPHDEKPYEVFDAVVEFVEKYK